VLHGVAGRCSIASCDPFSLAIQCGALWRIVLHCVAVCCSVLQCVAVCCTVLNCVKLCCIVLPCAVVCCVVSRRNLLSVALQCLIAMVSQPPKVADRRGATCRS